MPPVSICPRPERRSPIDWIVYGLQVAGIGGAIAAMALTFGYLAMLANGRVPL